MPEGLLFLLIVLGAGAILWLQLFSGAGYGYELQDTRLVVLAGGLSPTRLIPYGEIIEARRATFAEFLIARHYGFTARNAVLLRMDRGFWPMAVVTPPNPEEFLRQLKARLPSRR